MTHTNLHDAKLILEERVYIFIANGAREACRIESMSPHFADGHQHWARTCSSQGVLQPIQTQIVAPRLIGYSWRLEKTAC